MSRACILLDRDGVLMEEVPYPSSPLQVRARPDAAQAVARAHAAGLGAWCCTNQPVVARGMVTPEGLEAIHQELDRQMRALGDAVDGYLVCPHAPVAGDPGANPAFAIPCDCRKPLPGLLLRAAREQGLRPGATIYVGDRTTDLLAAERAGMLGVGLLQSYACSDGKHPVKLETPLFPSVADAVSMVVTTARAELLRASLAGRRVVLVGGDAGSGKTVLASAIRIALETVGVPVVRLCVDRLAAHEQGTAVTSLLADGHVTVPLQDAATRAGVGTETLDLPRDAALVVDGVHAHGLHGLPDALRIQLHAPVDVRRARLAAMQAWRGLPATEETETLAGTTPVDLHLQVLDDGSVVPWEGRA